MRKLKALLRLAYVNFRWNMSPRAWGLMFIGRVPVDMVIDGNSAMAEFLDAFGINPFGLEELPTTLERVVGAVKVAGKTTLTSKELVSIIIDAQLNDEELFEFLH